MVAMSVLECLNANTKYCVNAKLGISTVGRPSISVKSSFHFGLHCPSKVILNLVTIQLCDTIRNTVVGR